MHPAVLLWFETRASGAESFNLCTYLSRNYCDAPACLLIDQYRDLV